MEFSDNLVLFVAIVFLVGFSITFVNRLKASISSVFGIGNAVVIDSTIGDQPIELRPGTSAAVNITGTSATSYAAKATSKNAIPNKQMLDTLETKMDDGFSGKSDISRRSNLHNYDVITGNISLTYEDMRNKVFACKPGVTDYSIIIPEVSLFPNSDTVMSTRFLRMTSLSTARIAIQLSGTDTFNLRGFGTGAFSKYYLDNDGEIVEIGVVNNMLDLNQSKRIMAPLILGNKNIAIVGTRTALTNTDFQPRGTWYPMDLTELSNDNDTIFEVNETALDQQFGHIVSKILARYKLTFSFQIDSTTTSGSYLISFRLRKRLTTGVIETIQFGDFNAGNWEVEDTTGQWTIPALTLLPGESIFVEVNDLTTSPAVFEGNIKVSNLTLETVI